MSQNASQYCKLHNTFERIVLLQTSTLLKTTLKFTWPVVRFTSLSKVDPVERKQLGNYKLNAAKSFWRPQNKVGPCHIYFPGNPLGGLHIYVCVTRQTDLTKKLIDNVKMYYYCVKTMFLVLFSSLCSFNVCDIFQF